MRLEMRKNSITFIPIAEKIVKVEEEKNQNVYEHLLWYFIPQKYYLFYLSEKEIIELC